MADLPDPNDYDDLEEWLADVTSSTQLDGETMDELVEKFSRSQWVK